MIHCGSRGLGHQVATGIFHVHVQMYSHVNTCICTCISNPNLNVNMYGTAYSCGCMVTGSDGMAVF